MIISIHCHYIGKYRGAARSIWNLKFNVPNEIPVDFYNGSNYDYHFIINELATSLRDNLNVLGKHRKVQNFVPIENEVTHIDKDGIESVVTIGNLAQVR